MQRILCKTAILLWFIATNVFAAAALEAAVHYPRFRIGYIIMAVIFITIWLGGWYYRIQRKTDRGVSESVLRYYWRSMLKSGKW